MRIHRVKLKNYRGVTDCEVAFADDGVTIVEGDNEVGKTSLLEAVNLILSTLDSSTAANVKAVKPVGRDEGAEVEVEMSTGPYRFTYAKRWHRQKQTTLAIARPAHEQLTGREAHERVQAILDETLDAALWAALQLEQGADLRQAGFNLVSLGRALDQAAGGDAAGDREDDLWSRIEAERARYWTPGGQPKVERTSLEASVAEATARVEELESELAGLDADAEEVARLVDEAKGLEERSNDARRAEADLVARAEAVARHRAAVRELTANCETALAQLQREQSAVDRRRELIEDVEARAESLASHELELDRARPARAAAEKHQQRVQLELQSARDAVARTDADSQRATDDKEYRRHQLDFEQLTERLERVVAAQGRLTEAEAALESSTMDDDLLQRIEDAHVDRARAEAAAVSGAVTVVATGLAAIDLDVDGHRQALAVDEAREFVITEAAEVIVPDVIRLSIQAGADARDLAERLAEAEATLARLCEQGGVGDLIEARAAAQARSDAERTVEEASAVVQQDLRDLTQESLAQKVTRLAERIVRYEATRPDDPPLPDDFDAAQSLARDCKAGLDERREQLARLEADAEAATAAFADAKVGDAGLRAKVEQARGSLSEARQSLGDARAASSDEALVANVDAVQERYDGLARKLDDAEAELAAEDPDTVEALLDNVRATKTRVGTDLHRNRERTRQLQVRLEIKGEEGRAHDLDVARTDLEHFDRERERLEARAAAAALLHQTFSARRVEARHRYVGPFRERIEQLGRIVFGPSLEVELDDDLRVARRTLDGVTVDFDQLSTGAREQIGIIARLACAAIVAADGGAPVVFDDALGWTDPSRLERMGATIAVAGRDCQIIVLTCTPGRYASVGTATVVHLPG